MSSIKLIVGLGNPGQKYEQTRHNIGFMLLDRLIVREGATFTNHLRWRAHIAKLSSGAILMKPQTFMNESGQSVGAALRFYKWKPEEVLVVYDDISLPFGALRFRMAGSSGGHNGIKSIIHHLGSDRFPRLKIGIDAIKDLANQDVPNAQKANKNVPSGGLVGHVLGKFSVEERNELENTLATAAEAVQFSLSNGVEAAANTFNTKKKAQPSPQKKAQTSQSDNLQTD